MRWILSLLAVASFAADTIPTERGGRLRVEAESFDRQTRDDIRQWIEISTADPNGGPQPDSDESHAASAAGGAHIEALPDTRATHDDELIPGENFTNDPGAMAIIEYDIEITHPGRYFVWVRAYSTGPEDNGIHVGLDGMWPESGQRLQWCEGKNAWTWASKQRTEEQHCGVPGQIWLDITTPGRHTVMFSMREDGFEMDAWELASDAAYIPTP